MALKRYCMSLLACMLTYFRTTWNNRNRPSARSSHMVQNHTCWSASCTVGLPRQCNLYQSTWTCLCFGSATAQLAGDFVPCDRIAQRAYQQIRLLSRAHRRPKLTMLGVIFFFTFMQMFSDIWHIT